MKPRKATPVGAWEPRLLGLVATVLLVFGIAAVYSASSIVAVRSGQPGSAFALRQVIGAVLGMALLLLGNRVDYDVWRRFAWPILGVAVLALVIPLLPFTHRIAPTINGARRWIDLGIFSFQPSEVAKLALLAWTAMLAAKKGDRIRDFQFGLLPFLVVIVPVCLLIALEPDLSTAVLALLVGLVVLFSAGAKIGHFLLIGIIALPLVWSEIATVQFRIQRMISFLSPGENPLDVSWQIGQSITGVGSGGILGVGFGEGMQKLGYLPYAYSDFVFSTIGEEWGFIGVTVLLILYGVYVSLGMRIAGRARDTFGTLLVVGLTALIGITAILHMAVTLALVPTTGLPLPFISYGRSNLLVALLGTGIIMNVGNGGSRKKK